MYQLQLFAEATVKDVEPESEESAELKEEPKRKPLPDCLDRIEQVLIVDED